MNKLKASQKLSQYRNLAEREFAHMNGSPFGRYGDPAYFNGGGMNQAVVNEMRKPERAYSITIKNTDEANDLTVSLFGKNLGLKDAYNGSADVNGVVSGAGKGLIVTFGDESHEIVKSRAAFKPVMVEGLRYTVPDATQLANQWKLLQREDNRRSETNYYPNDLLGPNQFQSNTVDDKTFTYLIDADQAIQFLVNKAPSATVPTLITLILFRRASIDQSKVLEGKTGIGVNSSDNVAGKEFY